jgi:hypothetical protein
MGHKYRYRPGQIVPGTGLKIIRPLGSGGMGAVYEVEETSVEALFVMKVVHPHLLLPGSNAAERMRQEAKTQARLNHKNIVRVYRAGVTAESPPLPYYVMDRLSGYNVRQVLRWHGSKGAFVPLGWTFWIAASVLQALDHAHTNGVVHRDVKPDNIFVHHVEGEKPVTKLLDFGIVAAISEFSDKTRLTAGGFAGTFTHASPEQLQGAKPAPTMDVYSTGMVLFEMLSGRRPFDDRKTAEEVIHAQLYEPAPPLSRAGIHPKLAAMVAQMLEKDPKKRPQSAREALRILSQIKMEWMQHNTDIAGADSVEFQFEVDLGERWPTNFGADDEFEDGVEAPAPERARVRRRSRSAELLAERELAKIPPLDLAAAGRRDRPSVPTRATWSQTLHRYKERVRASHVAVAAAGFAGVTAGLTWLWLRSTGPEASTVTSSQAGSGATWSSATQPSAPVTVNAPREFERVPPPAAAPMPSQPVFSHEDASALASLTKSPQPQATSARGAKKPGPLPRKPAEEKQPPASASAAPERPPEGTVEDPMKP